MTKPHVNAPPRLSAWLTHAAPPWEVAVATLGAFLGLLATALLTRHLVGGQVPLLVASMGASSVLLFALPHAPLSQPWPVIGGHTLSALVGVSCVLLLGPGPVTAGVAVGLAIGTMLITRCLHPPGGASALTAVIGGQQVVEMGYQFVLTPVLLNALLITLLAVLVHSPFPARRYPLRPTPVHAPRDRRRNVPRAALLAALKRADHLLDISEEELEELIDEALALAPPTRRRHTPESSNSTRPGEA